MQRFVDSSRKYLVFSFQVTVRVKIKGIRKAYIKSNEKEYAYLCLLYIILPVVQSK